MTEGDQGNNRWLTFLNASKGVPGPWNFVYIRQLIESQNHLQLGFIILNVQVTPVELRKVDSLSDITQ